MQNTNKWLYAVPAGLFIISLIASTIFFRNQKPPIAEQPVSPEIEEVDEALIAVEPTMPKTEICPLNGAMYTKPEQESWSKRRPLAVMVENSQDARPQSGLANADIVFEAVAEGGITRFMAMYYCDAQKEDILIAPVRSARTYFINLASGFNLPMYVHVGGANLEGPTNALGQLADYGWNMQNAINQFSVGYPTFIRDYNRLPGKEVATEHTMTTTSEKLWAVAEKRGWTNMSKAMTVNRKTIEPSDWQDGYKGWTFEDGASKGQEQKVSYSFWTGLPNFDVSWTYDASNNVYLRTLGGEKHLDLNTDEQLAFTSVITMFAKETGPINEAKHMMYEVIGKGKGILFANGEAQEIQWAKKTRESELELSDKNGKELVMPRGKIWVSVLPDGNKVTY